MWQDTCYQVGILLLTVMIETLWLNLTMTTIIYVSESRNLFMNFMESLKQTATKLQASGNSEPVPTPKNPRLYFGGSKGLTEGVFRILPSREMMEGKDANNWASGMRTLWLAHPVDPVSHQEYPTTLQLPLEADPESPMEQKIARWLDEGKLKNGNFDSRPRVLFLLNVIQLKFNAAANKFEPMTFTDDGKPMVQVLQVPKSAYESIVKDLLDPMNMPEPSLPFSFISLEDAFPVKISKPDRKAQDKTYSVNLAANFHLDKLDKESVIDQVEDLSKFTFESAKLQPDWTHRVVGYMDGKPYSRGVNEDISSDSDTAQENPYKDELSGDESGTPNQTVQEAPEDPFAANKKPESSTTPADPFASTSDDSTPVENSSTESGNSTADPFAGSGLDDILKSNQR